MDEEYLKNVKNPQKGEADYEISQTFSMNGQLDDEWDKSMQ